MQQRTKEHCSTSSTFAFERCEETGSLPLSISSSLSTPICSLLRSEISIHSLSVHSALQSESLSLSLLQLSTTDRKWTKYISVVNNYRTDAETNISRILYMSSLFGYYWTPMGGDKVKYFILLKCKNAYDLY